MSTLRVLSLLTLTATFFLAACSDAPKDTHPDQLVTQRKAIFKDFTRTLEPIGLVARGRKDYNPREVNVSALELQRLATQPWAYFTPDGNYPPTHATPAVWEKPAEFKQAQDNYLVTVNDLVASAQSGDLARIKAAVTSVQNSCKTCHDQFRSNI